MEALSSWSAAAGGGREEEEGSRRRLLGISRDKVELTEEEVRANDRRQEDEIGNNNHLYYCFCNQHCCALCRKPVQKMTRHFAPTGCKQHTANC